MLDGNQQVGNISGNGTVKVEQDTALTAQSLIAEAITLSPAPRSALWRYPAVLRPVALA